MWCSDILTGSVFQQNEPETDQNQEVNAVPPGLSSESHSDSERGENEEPSENSRLRFFFVVYKSNFNDQPSVRNVQYPSTA